MGHTLAIGSQVSAQSIRTHEFYQYLVARQWNPMAQFWEAEMMAHAPVAGTVYDPQPSPLGLSYKAVKKPILKKGKSTKIPGHSPEVLTHSFIAASQLGGCSGSLMPLGGATHG